MLKPSILITLENGKPVCQILDVDADKALQAYKATTSEAYLFIRPIPTKSKKALKGDAPEPAEKPKAPKGKK